VIGKRKREGGFVLGGKGKKEQMGKEERFFSVAGGRRFIGGEEWGGIHVGGGSPPAAC